jgi:hypothetical protein
MPNPRLTSDQLLKVKALLNRMRWKLLRLAGDDLELLFAYRRKLAKELIYDERSKPSYRKRLKEKKRREQGRKCAKCELELPQKYAALDRIDAKKSYILDNVRVLCPQCDVIIQAGREYSDKESARLNLN